MAAESTELQRLDFVARSQCDDRVSLATFRLFMTGFVLLAVFLASISEAPPHEMFMVCVLAVVALICVVISWMQERYAGYAWGTIFSAMGVGALLTRDYSPTTAGWTARLSLVIYMSCMAFLFFRRAWRQTVTQGPSWEKEREQVQRWTAILRTSEESPEVLQFSSESFWTGYFIYRMVNTGSHWVVAKFKKGHAHNIIGCRVLDQDAVRQTQLRPGELGITIDDRSIPKVKASPDMHVRLLNSLNLK